MKSSFRKSDVVTGRINDTICSESRLTVVTVPEIIVSAIFFKTIAKKGNIIFRETLCY